MYIGPGWNPTVHNNFFLVGEDFISVLDPEFLNLVSWKHFFSSLKTDYFRKMRKSGRKPICSFQTGNLFRKKTCAFQASKKFIVGRLVLFKPARSWQIIKPDSKTESGLQLSQELSKPKFSFQSHPLLRRWNLQRSWRRGYLPWVSQFSVLKTFLFLVENR